MGYGRGDSFPFDFEPNGVPFGSKLKEKLSSRSYPIQCEKKWKFSFLRVISSQGPFGASEAIHFSVALGKYSLCQISLGLKKPYTFRRGHFSRLVRHQTELIWH